MSSVNVHQKYFMDSGRKYGNWFIFSIAVTVLVLIGQIFAYPNAVRNILHSGFDEGITLKYPAIHTLLAPIFQIADRVTILSAAQLLILFAYLNAVWLLWRINKCLKHRISFVIVIHETVRYIGFNAFVLLCVFLAILVPRPQAAIAVTDPDVLVLDFQTHTNYSWDARESATPASQMQRRFNEGFNAFFITDHNNRFSDLETKEITGQSDLTSRAIPLRGEEISAKPSNLIILGPNMDHRYITRQKTDTSQNSSKALEVVLKNREDPNTFVFATGPARWWKNSEDLQFLIGNGLEGIEIAKASPKGLELTVEDRVKLTDFARQNRIVMLGSSDNHGFGYAGYVWNLLRLPGWRSLEPKELEQAVISRMRLQGPDALTIITRIKAEPTGNPFLMGIDPFRQIWEMMRSLPLAQATVFVLYSWIPLVIRLTWLALFPRKGILRQHPVLAGPPTVSAGIPSDLQPIRGLTRQCQRLSD